MHFNMGNAWGERRFAKSARLFSSKLSSNLAVEQRLSLHCNAAELGLAGYVNSFQNEDDNGDEEQEAGLRRAFQ